MARETFYWARHRPNYSARYTSTLPCTPTVSLTKTKLFVYPCSNISQQSSKELENFEGTKQTADDQEEALQLDVPVLLFGMCDLERLQQRPVLALDFAITTWPEGRVATVLDTHLRQELSELVGRVQTIPV